LISRGGFASLAGVSIWPPVFGLRWQILGPRRSRSERQLDRLFFSAIFYSFAPSIFFPRAVFQAPAQLFSPSDFVQEHARGRTFLPCWTLVCTGPVVASSLLFEQGSASLASPLSLRVSIRFLRVIVRVLLQVKPDMIFELSDKKLKVYWFQSFFCDGFSNTHASYLVK
jgi:hypothetical protein